MSKDKRKIIVASGDDWQGLFIDGELVEEDHSLDWPRILRRFLGVEVEQRHVNYSWLCDEGHLPNKIEDVVWEGEEPK